MYILSFNINKKIDSERIVLTETPTILVNDDLKKIMNQIRSLITKKFENISALYNIPLVDMILGVSILYKKDTFVYSHSCTINLINIRETKELIKKISSDE